MPTRMVTILNDSSFSSPVPFQECAMRLCPGILLTWLILLPGWQTSTDPPDQAVKQSTAPDQAPRTDRHGDPLPSGVTARLGTARFRQGLASAVVFAPDGKSLATSGRF